MSERWVINASPTILLAKAGLMPQVAALAAPLVIPEPVAEEIRRARTRDAAVQWLAEVGTRFVQPAAPPTAGLAGVDIGAGERAVISWALANPGFTAVLDDLAARKAAIRLGQPVIGSVGVVLALKRAGHVPEARPLLLQLRQAGGFISDALLREALRRAGEPTD